MADLRVEVTEEMIEAAARRDSQRCMIAEAIKLQNPHFEKILVDLQTIRWSNPRTNKRYVCLTPQSVGVALVEFDRGVKSEPFAFGLRVAQRTPLQERETRDEHQLRLDAGDTSTKNPRERRRRGSRRVVAGLDKAQPVVEGGKPYPAGHLRGGSDGLLNVTKAKKKAEAAEERARHAAESGGNLRASSSRYRVYGLRLLRD